ncbi:MAG: hypothetical protein JSW02_08005 [candidate division WOR-3 bacterium]|nr:MAG: hypothetical protein JSW02_08005 [candidate division WOR-3 bacterium]
MRRYLLLVVIIGLCSASNYITNGDFEAALTTGWTQQQYGTYITITRGTTYDSDPDYEVFLSKGTGTGYAMIHQTAEIPTLNLDISFNAKLKAWDNYVGAWSAAAVQINYLDATNTVLGDTRVCRFSQDCLWSNSSTRHLIMAPDENWHNYQFNILDELENNLPGIDLQAVDKIQVILIDSTWYC